MERYSINGWGIEGDHSVNDFEDSGGEWVKHSDVTKVLKLHDELVGALDHFKNLLRNATEKHDEINDVTCSCFGCVRIGIIKQIDSILQQEKASPASNH